MFVLITTCSEQSYWYQSYIGQVVEIAVMDERYFFMDKHSSHNLHLVKELRDNKIGRSSHPLILNTDAAIIDSPIMTNDLMVVLLKKDGD
jgi:hypothetical protein